MPDTFFSPIIFFLLGQYIFYYPLPAANLSLSFPSKTAVELCWTLLPSSACSHGQQPFSGLLSNRPFGEVTHSSSHLQYCPHQSEVKVANLGSCLTHGKKSWFCQSHRHQRVQTAFASRYLERTEALSKSHFLLTPQRLELSKAHERHTGLHSLMWFKSCDNISHCDRLYLKP